MCLDYVYSEGSKKEWLDKKPDVIIAYKVVMRNTRNGKYYPLFFSRKTAFKTTNTLTQQQLKHRKSRGVREYTCVYSTGRRTDTSIYYEPYFHFYSDEFLAKDYFGRRYNTKYRKTVIIKCEIMKKNITEVGLQSTYDVKESIVATSFKIMGEVDVFGH